MRRSDGHYGGRAPVLGLAEALQSPGTLVGPPAVHALTYGPQQRYQGGGFKITR